MKTRSISNRFLAGLLISTVAVAPVIFAAPSPTPKNAAKTPAAQPSPEPEIPQSLFTLPTNSKEGKDPFYPASTRPYSSGAPVRTNTIVKPGPAVDLVLNGISGTPEKPLAMINGRTFGNNEEGEVPSNGVRVHIRCVEVKADSAIVEFRGERRELKLRKGL